MALNAKSIPSNTAAHTTNNARSTTDPVSAPMAHASSPLATETITSITADANSTVMTIAVNTTTNAMGTKNVMSQPVSANNPDMLPQAPPFPCVSPKAKRFPSDRNRG